MDVAEVRKRLRLTIERARRQSADRRKALAEAGDRYERFLKSTAIPLFRTFANVLAAEGYPFSLATPEGRVQLIPARAGGDVIEIELDAARLPPAAIGRSTHTLGRQVTTIEHVLGEGKPIGELSDEDVLAFLLTAIEPFVRRG
jgi:hypothetical protein